MLKGELDLQEGRLTHLRCERAKFLADEHHSIMSLFFIGLCSTWCTGKSIDDHPMKSKAVTPHKFSWAAGSSNA